MKKWLKKYIFPFFIGVGSILAFFLIPKKDRSRVKNIEKNINDTEKNIDKINKDKEKVNADIKKTDNKINELEKKLNEKKTDEVEIDKAITYLKNKIKE